MKKYILSVCNNIFELCIIVIKYTKIYNFIEENETAFEQMKREIISRLEKLIP